MDSLLAWAMSKIVETLPKNFRHVCSFYANCKICEHQHLYHIVFWEGRVFRLFLMLNIECKVTYAIVANDLTVADFVGDANRENFAAKLVEGDEDSLRKFLEQARKTDAALMLKYLTTAEKQETMCVADQHLYDYLKTLLTLNQIA